MMDLVVKGAALFDGREVRSDAAVGVDGGRIAWVGARDEAPEAAQTLETAGTVLPGLLDLHFHQFAMSGLTTPGVVQRPPDVSLNREPLIAARVFKAERVGRAWLRSGVTTVRDAGAPEYLAVAMKEAVEDGWVECPRVVPSGPLIAQTGGLRPGKEANAEEITGVDEARRTARLQLKRGVEVIKIYGASSIGGGGGRLIGPPGWPHLTEEEMRAIVEEAHKASRLASAHAVSAESIKNAVRAGVDWVDHADFLDAEAIDLLLEHDTPIVPTQAIAWSLATFGEEMGFGQHIARMAREVGEQAKEGLAVAWKSGVRMATGTDADNPRASIAKECELFTEIGMSPLDTLRAATSVAAEVLGKDAELGSIDVGKIADLVLIDGRPADRVTDLDNVEAVVKAGVLVSTSDRGA